MIAVKVLGDDGFGWWSDMSVTRISTRVQILMLVFSISGVDWVATTAASTGRPSVASMSLGGSTFEPVDTAVANVTCLFSSTKPSANTLNSWLLPESPLPSLVSCYLYERPMHSTLTMN